MMMMLSLLRSAIRTTLQTHPGKNVSGVYICTPQLLTCILIKTDEVAGC